MFHFFFFSISSFFFVINTVNMFIRFVDIVFSSFGDEYGRRHVPPTLFSKYFYVLTLTMTTRAQVQNAWFTKHVSYEPGFVKNVDNVCGHCG